MSERVCLVHYHEIGLKGKNRSIFENQLVTNLKCALRDTPLKCVKRICGYILVTFEGGATRDYQDLIGKVPGVARVSLAHECPRDLAEYSQAAIVSLGEAGSFSTFKVHAHKSSTDYPVHTLDINRQVGAALCEAFPDKKVDVHNPDVTVHVNVVQGSVYVYA